MAKEKKQESVELAKGILSGNEMCIVLNYKGLSAGDFVNLRSSLKDSGANVRVIKNTLLRRAVDGTGFSPMADYFRDQVAISYSNDAVALSGAISRFSRENEHLKIKMASFNGEIVDVRFVEELASLGSMNDIRSRFIGVLRAPSAQLVRLLAAYEEKLRA
ncbi:MAG: 50S ribosomal protein L10 [Rickettsiales bacterium]|jgi:large subunit ribosomal protein L10|nr:50S ribosomal protein L10 [Rickettsiales bacterium]